jgi:hypothetical protein
MAIANAQTNLNSQRRDESRKDLGLLRRSDCFHRAMPLISAVPHLQKFTKPESHRHKRRVSTQYQQVVVIR